MVRRAHHPGAVTSVLPVSWWIRLREVVLAALPAVLTVVLLLLATQPAYETLIRNGNGWTPYAYQALAQDVLAYQVAQLDPRQGGGQRQMKYEMALSSAANPGQFTMLPAVEAHGDARLARIEALLRQNTAASIAQAAREAIRLNAQAGDFANETRVQYVQALEAMRRALIGTALITGILSMLLTVRALLLWRAERERRSRREARQREALSLASHELRRPLQALLFASDLLRQADTPEQREHLLSLIEDSTAQLASRADLTNLQDLYMDVNLRLTRPDLRPLVQRAAGGRVCVQVPAEPVLWPVDVDRLRQIIENLVENALKYTSGPVEVALATPGGRPTITVRDFGPGIPIDLRERVFLPYERGSHAPAQGQGLGLPLVRRYARAHGGDVTLEDAPGGGTLARLTLGEPPRLEKGQDAPKGRETR